MVQRSRACEDCHTLKIKCDPSISNPDACERCARFKLECIPATRRWQRDRIKELEGQVRELTDALQESRSSTTGTSLTRATSADSAGEEGESREFMRATRTRYSTDDLRDFLDGVVTREQQAQGLKAFKDRVLPLWPVIFLGTGDGTTMRSSSAILLITILGFGISSQRADITSEVQNKLRKRAMVTFGAAAIGVDKPSLELVQSLLTAAFWHRPAHDASLGNCNQLVRTATEIAIELGIGGPNMLSSAAAWFTRLKEPFSTDIKATWLACYIASTLSDIDARRPLSNFWTQWHQDCLYALRDDKRYASTVFLHLVEMARMHENIASKHDLCDISIFHDIASDDEQTYDLPNRLKAMVQTCRNTIPLTLGHLSEGWQFYFWYHIADVHINEPVLHTSTNKGLFAVPFIAERIGVDDFACPKVITSRRVYFLKSLIKSCHAAIEVVSRMTSETMLGLPSLCFAPAVSYALWILIKVHVAVSAPGNTYRRVLSHSDVQLRDAMQKLKAVNARLQEADPGMTSWNTRIIGSVEWLEAWLDNYEEILRQYQANLKESSMAGPTVDMMDANENT